MKFQSALCFLLAVPATNGFVSRTPAAPVVSTTSLNAADRRVVVTGMGIVSCLGNTLEDVKTSLHEAKSGITFQEKFAELGIKSNVAGVPDLTEADFKELIPKAALRFMGQNAKFAYISLDRAIQDSGLKPEEYEENGRVAPSLDRVEHRFPTLSKPAMLSRDKQSDGRTRSDPSVSPVPWDRRVLPSLPPTSRSRDPVSPSVVPAVPEPIASERVSNKSN